METNNKTKITTEEIKFRKNKIKKDKKIAFISIVINTFLIAILILIIALRGNYWAQMGYLFVPIIYGVAIGIEISEIISYSSKISKHNDELKKIEDIERESKNGKKDIKNEDSKV